MKTTFKTFALMLLTALTFSSCVDVPAPYSLPEKSSSSGSSVDEGTLVTCAQAVELTKALSDKGTSTGTYTITGYITEVVGNVSNSQQIFWMADTKDGGRIFEAYYANLPDGITEFKVGTKVKITGKLMKYVSNSGNITCEMKNPVVTILSEEGGGSTAEEGTPVTCAQALEIINSLEDGASSPQTYSVTGYITDVFAISGKPCFWMADTPDGGKVIEAFNYSVPSGVAELKAGMKVKIIGKLKKYVNKSNVMTPEMENPTVVVLDDSGSGSDTPADASTIVDFTKGQGSWTISNVSGPEVWTNSSQYGQVASGFDNDNKVCQAAEGWLISPEIDLTNCTNTQIVINEAVNKIGTGNTVDVQCQVLVRIGSDATSSSTNWQVLTADKRPAGTSWTFQDDTFNASAFDGKKVQLAFKYVSTEASAPSWEIKTVKLNAGGSQGGNSGQGGDQGGDQGGEQGDDIVTELVNGGFESWVSDSEVMGWKSQSSASLSTISKNSDAHEGSMSCFIQADATANKRLATQEITLEAGTYTFSYYAKAATATTAQTKCGYASVTINEAGEYKVVSYKYGSFFNLSNTEWTFVSYEFTLDKQTTVCLVIMNPKTNANIQYTAADILIDDATLVKK